MYVNQIFTWHTGCRDQLTWQLTCFTFLKSFFNSPPRDTWIYCNSSYLFIFMYFKRFFVCGTIESSDFWFIKKHSGYRVNKQRKTTSLFSPSFGSVFFPRLDLVYLYIYLFSCCFFFIKCIQSAGAENRDDTRNVYFILLLKTFFYICICNLLITRSLSRHQPLF